MDCREEFLESAEKTCALGVGDSSFIIYRPLIRLGKNAIIKEGLNLGAPLHLTWSCYRGDAEPCGHCDSCLIRAAGFAAAGVQDPATNVSLQDLWHTLT